MRRLILSAAAALLLAFPAWGQDRGVLRVVEPGTGTEVALYEESHALIIGNSAYTNGWGRLPGVRDDVLVVKEALERHGFKVQVAENLATRQAMQQALDGFVRRFGQRPNNRLLIYYAGHGHTAKLAYGGEMGYLAPTSAPDPFKDPEGFHAEAISMEEIGSLSRRIQAKHALFVFDSCFSGTVFKAMRAAAPPSIQRKTGLPVRQFITSGDKDQPVPDSSVFRRQFVAALNGETDAGRDGYLTGTALGNFLETTVSDYTRNSQTPQYGKLLDPNLDKGDFVFLLKPPPPVVRAPRAVDDRWKELEAGRPYRLSVLDNDAAAAGGALRVASVGAVPRGRAEVAADGKTIIYTAPTDGAGGDVSFTYRLREEGGGEAEGRVTLALTAPPKQEPPRSNVIPVVGVFPQAKSVFKDCPDCPEMVVIPAGSFMMGSPDSEAGRRPDEGPQRRVTIPRDFAVGRYEVTRGEFSRFIAASGRKTEAGCHVWTGSEWKQDAGRNWRDPGFTQTDTHPATCLSWNDSQAYVAWLSQKTGKGYRLLTEAEWEYAARAGTTTAFSTGETITAEQANFNGNYTYNRSAVGFYRQRTTPAGDFPANPFGLYDMQGNIGEWVEDCYMDSYQGAPLDGIAVTRNSYCQRVNRGGSWYDSPGFLRAAARLRNHPGNRLHNFGFRVARTLP